MVTKQQWTALKAQLTRATRADNAVMVAKACRSFLAAFDGQGWPDDWHRWNIAAQDHMAVTLDWMEANPDAVPTCSWFAGCERDAVKVVAHPAFVHKVPVCQRHYEFATQE